MDPLSLALRQEGAEPMTPMLIQALTRLSQALDGAPNGSRS